MNKSLKTLHEDKSNVASSFTNSITSMKKGVIPTAGTRVIDLNEKPKTLKYTPVQSIPRSSSASHFEKEGTDVIHDNPAPLTPLTSNIPPQRGVIPSSTIAHTKSLDNEVNRNVGGGNIIHVTVNNFMAPLNNVNNVIQTTTSNLINDKSNVQSSKSKRDNLSMSSSDRKQENNNTKGGNYPTETNINQAEPYSKILTDPAVDKSKYFLYRRSIIQT